MKEVEERYYRKGGEPRKSFEVFVEPQVLVWSRESMGRNVEEVANRLHVSDDLVKRWESGEKKPTLNQLKSLTNYYKRPLAVFFLPSPPKEHSLPKDFRTLPEERKISLSSNTRLVVRRARRLQSLAIELGSTLQQHIVLKIGSVSLLDDPEVVATQTREELLRVNLQTQFRWENENVALSEWIKAIENLGLLILQTSMPIEEARALSLTDGGIPVIILNTKDSIRARIFSLIHEFGHILLNKGGICDPNRGIWDIPDQHISSEGIRLVEEFCNHFAGALLVPKDALLSHEWIKPEKIPSEWSDNVLGRVARDFKVSQEVILRRLVILKLASRNFYQKKRDEWDAKAKVAKEEEKQKYLFSLKLDYKQHLKDGFVIDALRGAFEDNKLYLTSEAKITQKDEKYWKIKDDKKIYKIEDTDTKLNIYEEKRGGGLPQPKKCIQENGVPFVSLVLDSYTKEKITYSDVADYLGIRLKHLPKVERLVRG
jgi:Zn-dependent peptidase ImmA (M78 family)/transcriptional regulator with XRE-family HTH domain